MTRLEANILLTRLGCTNLRTCETRNGVAWSSTLTLDGKAVLRVSNEGNGGGNDYYPVKGGDHREARAIETRLTDACKTLGLGDFEPLDTLTCAIEPGMNGMQAAHVALRHAAEYDAAYGVGGAS